MKMRGDIRGMQRAGGDSKIHSRVCGRIRRGTGRGWCSLFAMVSVALVSCAPEPSAPRALYSRLAQLESDHEVAIDLILAGERTRGVEALDSAAERLRASAAECASTPGCDVSRFVDTLATLLKEQGRLLARRSRNPHAASGKVVPESKKARGELPGVDLDDLLAANRPVKAALDDWLTWRRSALMDAYENYQFLRARIAPVYEEAGFPEALLFAIIATESGGKVHAYSRAGAVGPLQFTRRTGRGYGLRTIDGFDMRLDPVAATKASAAYLQRQMAALDGDLAKTLAAYNGGETRVKSLHRSLGDANLWEARMYFSLPRETREYVPRVLAAAGLFLHPEDYNLQWPFLKAATITLVVEQDIALDELTICLGQEGNRNGWFRTLRNLNPRLATYERVERGGSIQIPASLASRYKVNCITSESVRRARLLHEASSPGDADSTSYVVRRGDTLGSIATRLPCASSRDIAKLNQVRPPRYVIRVGQRLELPSCG